MSFFDKGAGFQIRDGGAEIPRDLPQFNAWVFDSVIVVNTMIACRFRADGRTVIAAVRFVTEHLLNAQHSIFVSSHHG